MGRVSIDIDIEDYIDEIDYDVLLDECISRTPKDEKEKNRRKELISSLCLDYDDIFTLFVESKGLTLVQAMKLEEFLNTLK